MKAEVFDDLWFREGSSPYSIGNADQLYAFSMICNDEYCDFAGEEVVLTSDIDLKDLGTWRPIGWNLPFAGTFDGNAHTIRGLSLIGADISLGFFTNINNTAVVQNLDFTDVSIEYHFHGGVVLPVGIVCGSVGNSYPVVADVLNQRAGDSYRGKWVQDQVFVVDLDRPFSCNHTVVHTEELFKHLFG